MKIHIVSLQRTGSKSLYNAIHAGLKNPLVFDTKDRLEEIFHGWGTSGYKFGAQADYPFDKKAEVIFRTSPNFDRYEGRNFKPQIIDGSAKWIHHDYMHHWDSNSALVLHKALLSQTTKDILVKSQLLDGSFPPDTVQDLLKGWDYIVTITPKDALRWVCSNYLCDRSGIFVPIKEQQDAALAFEACRVIMPLPYVREKLSVLKRHWTVINNIKTPVIHLFTENLNTSQSQLTKLGLGILDVPVVKEFSNSDYSTMIFNYDEVANETSNFLS